jgi:hypothetical protein
MPVSSSSCNLIFLVSQSESVPGTGVTEQCAAHTTGVRSPARGLCVHMPVLHRCPVRAQARGWVRTAGQVGGQTISGFS